MAKAKSGKKPSIKQHKLKTSKKLSGVRALARGTCLGISNNCGVVTNTILA
jgi:hypothetical protein